MVHLFRTVESFSKLFLPDKAPNGRQSFQIRTFDLYLVNAAASDFTLIGRGSLWAQGVRDKLSVAVTQSFGSQV